MAYIGQSIKNGTFTTLDTSGNTYNGSNTAFALGTQVGSPAQLLVSHDGVIQKPGTDYTLSSGGTAITFTTAPASGASIFIVEISGAVGGPLGSDLNGSELILDADGDTSLHASTDDQIDVKIAGADDFKFSANAMNVLSGSTLTVDSGATLTVSGSTNLANTPAFFAISAADQSIANNTFVKLVLGTETLDSDAKFADSRFTPTVAGYYQLTAGTKIANVDSAEIAQITFYKNGSDYQFGKHYHQGNDTDGERFLSTSTFMYLDADDYVEVFAHHNEGGAQNAQAANTFFSGFRIIGV